MAVGAVRGAVVLAVAAVVTLVERDGFTRANEIDRTVDDAPEVNREGKNQDAKRGDEADLEGSAEA